MLIEVGDFSEVGEAWVRYQGTKPVADYAELLRDTPIVDPTGALAPERRPRLVQFYELTPAELEHSYTVGACWVFEVARSA